MTRSATVPAFAKINLGLRILHRRQDGFHELRTVFHTVSLADRIRVSFTGGRQTSVSVQGMPDIPDNLAAKAAHAVLHEARATGGVLIEIDKRIPMGAGLGGGSSDAAALLLALPVLAGKTVPLSRLLAIAAALGSDVPFFLLGGAVLGMGRGEELYPLPDYPAMPGILLAPGIHVSTPAAFRSLSPKLAEPETKLLQFQESVREPLARPLINDFEPVVFGQHPRLAAMKRKLTKLGAQHALMSGSGSCIFGLFNRKETLPTVVQSGNRESSFRISLVNRSRYRSRWIKCLEPHSKGDLWPPRSLYAR